MPASQHEDCIFCKIARGDIPCTSVFESEELIAFLDISPVNKGHTLLVPKAHMETLFRWYRRNVICCYEAGGLCRYKGDGCGRSECRSE